ncbi:MAG: hypothetical protein Q9182_001476 [Xanthomendoza sp. 2 TL-2023]
MATSEWPQGLPLDDRLLDLALLIKNDQLPQLRDRILSDYNEEKHFTVEAFLPFLDDVGNLLYGQGSQPHNGRNCCKREEEIGFRIRGCARAAVPARRRSQEPDGAIEKWEDKDTDTSDIKDEWLNEDRLAEIADRSLLRYRGSLKTNRPFNNRNPRVATIKVMDPDAQNEVRRLGQARVADLVSNDMIKQGLGPGSFSIRIFNTSGHVRLMMPTTRQASKLKDRQRFRPLSFGYGAYVQQIGKED